MHMLSGKDLNSAALEAARVSQSPTTVVTANGDVQTEEATVYVKESDLFVTVKLLEDAGRSFSRKTLRGSRIFLRVDQWSETTTHQRLQTDKRQHGELRTDRCPWFIDRLFKLSYTFPPTSTTQVALTPTLHLASTRSESTSGILRRSPSHEPTETKTQIQMETTKECGEIRCVICQNG